MSSENELKKNVNFVDIKLEKKEVIPPIIYSAFNLLIKDQKFMERLELSINNILKDGKIDQYDIPEIIFVIVDAYNTMSKVKLNYEDLPILIKLIYNHIVDKLNLIPLDRRSDFEKLVESALKLVMLQPAVAKAIKGCTNSLFRCVTCNKNK